MLAKLKNKDELYIFIMILNVNTILFSTKRIFIGTIILKKKIINLT